MNAIDVIRQWCSNSGYSFVYGNPMHVNEWMNGTDFAASTGGTAVYCHLLTASDYDGSRDTYNLGIYFATLIPFDFDNNTIDATTDALKERAKTLLADLQAGNELSWSGARFQYGYDDYAENVCWCCLRVTLTALASDCVDIPTPDYNVQLLDSTAGLEWLTSIGGGNGQSLCDTFAMGDVSGYTTLLSLNIITDMQVAVYNSMFTLNHGQNIAVACSQITDDVIANIPSLADYKDKWAVSVMAFLDGHHTETATLSIPAIDVELSCEITW